MRVRERNDQTRRGFGTCRISRESAVGPASDCLVGTTRGAAADTTSSAIETTTGCAQHPQSTHVGAHEESVSDACSTKSQVSGTTRVAVPEKESDSMPTSRARARRRIKRLYHTPLSRLSQRRAPVHLTPFRARALRGVAKMWDRKWVNSHISAVLLGKQRVYGGGGGSRTRVRKACRRRCLHA